MLSLISGHLKRSLKRVMEKSEAEIMGEVVANAIELW